MIYLNYLWYVVKHKWFVMIECFKMGLIWQGIIHDNSKFFPSEFIPYARHFRYGIQTGRNKTGYYKPTNTGDKAFDFAWFLHQKRNAHHWQYWTIPDDSEGLLLMLIPDKYLKEMICDWIGAGKAQGKSSPKEDKYLETRNWYMTNKDKIQINTQSRIEIERIIKKEVNNANK
jgi:hypothetical protein